MNIVEIQRFWSAMRFTAAAVVVGVAVSACGGSDDDTRAGEPTTTTPFVTPTETTSRVPATPPVDSGLGAVGTACGGRRRGS
ncbi:hypothetical protein F8M49_21845 [Rhodococcus zopfii]|uniref:Lipoprotein n=1 Tax=Rhodococcus zopfii TaxID=43772 RepID=A0ABU3WTN2_9NOCA|nr:hypothetical protein [Rhodococcus zopfii]